MGAPVLWTAPGSEAVASGLGAAPLRVDVAQAHELAVDEVVLVWAWGFGEAGEEGAL